MSFAHLTLATSDIEATAAFFQNTLGWARVHAPENSPIPLAWLQIGPRQQLHLLQRDDFQRVNSDTEFCRHFAVFHDGRGFDALKQRILSHGGTLIDPIRPTPFQRFFFKDPNGYLFEVIDEQHYVAE